MYLDTTPHPYWLHVSYVILLCLLVLQVWEYPRIFTVGKDYRRHIRKFQYLELYGLKLPGRTSSSSSSSSKHEDGSSSDSGSDSDGYCSRGVRDSLEWLLLTVQN